MWISKIPSKKRTYFLIFILLLTTITVELLYLLDIETKSKKLTKGTFLPLQTQRNTTLQETYFQNGIHIISDVPGFSIQIKDKTGFQKYLDSIHLLDADGVMLIGEMKEKTVKGVEIHFSGNPSIVKFDEIANPKVGRFAGSSAKIIGDILRVDIFLLPELYYQKGQKKFSRYFSIGVARALFLSSRQSRQMGINVRKEKLKEISKKAYQGNWFKITKTSS